MNNQPADVIIKLWNGDAMYNNGVVFKSISAIQNTTEVSKYVLFVWDVLLTRLLIGQICGSYLLCHADAFIYTPQGALHYFHTIWDIHIKYVNKHNYMVSFTK